MTRTLEKKDIYDCVSNTVQQVNTNFNLQPQIEVNGKTALLGPQSQLDSLSFIFLTTSIEDWLEMNYDVTLILADLQSLNPEDTPFASIDKLVDHIHTKASSELQ